jgi:hypothetical protein
MFRVVLVTYCIGIHRVELLHHIACCVLLRVACCVLRVACCVLCVACCVLRVVCCVLRVAWCMFVLFVCLCCLRDGRYVLCSNL